LLLDFRIMFTASFAAVLLLVGGFATLAFLRTQGKPAVAIVLEEITGTISKGDERAHALTPDDKAARPAPLTAAPAPSAPPAEAAPGRPPAPGNASLENVEKAENPDGKQAAKVTEKAAAKKPEPKAAAKPKPRPRVAARQPPGYNFNANNPFVFPIFGTGGEASQ
jgi:hypothetical protein